MKLNMIHETVRSSGNQQDLVGIEKNTGGFDTWIFHFLDHWFTDPHMSNFHESLYRECRELLGFKPVLSHTETALKHT